VRLPSNNARYRTLAQLADGAGAGRYRETVLRTGPWDSWGRSMNCNAAKAAASGEGIRAEQSLSEIHVRGGHPRTKPPAHDRVRTSRAAKDSTAISRRAVRNSIQESDNLPGNARLKAGRTRRRFTIGTASRRTGRSTRLAAGFICRMRGAILAEGNSNRRQWRSVRELCYVWHSSVRLAREFVQAARF
jgi:hypothetical protein